MYRILRDALRVGIITEDPPAADPCLASPCGSPAGHRPCVPAYGDHPQADLCGDAGAQAGGRGRRLWVVGAMAGSLVLDIIHEGLSAR